MQVRKKEEITTSKRDWAPEQAVRQEWSPSKHCARIRSTLPSILSHNQKKTLVNHILLPFYFTTNNPGNVQLLSPVISIVTECLKPASTQHFPLSSAECIVSFCPYDKDMKEIPLSTFLRTSVPRLIIWLGPRLQNLHYKLGSFPPLESFFMWCLHQRPVCPSLTCVFSKIQSTYSATLV